MLLAMTRRTMTDFDCDVLVAGLGPSGDVLAGLLRKQGVSVIGIDKELDIFPLPRAAVFDQEIMRIFQMLDVAEHLETVCRVPPTYRFVTAKREILLEFPVAQGRGKWGWSESYALHQPAVERALRDRVAALGVDTRLGWALKAVQQDEGAVRVEVESRDGERKTLQARYLVGCDGASSLTRESAGIELFDYNFDEPWLVFDAILEEGQDLPQYAMQVCDPQRPTTFLRMSGPRYRWEFMLKPGEDPVAFASEENLAALIAPWGIKGRIQIERRAIYRFHGLVAKQWRKGRVLLAGDAAHQMPPFAGQGMCSGVRDAANLAWKLAWVLRNGADPALLDSYQQEREPHVRTIIETAVAMGRVVCALDPVAAAKRDEQMLARKASGVQDVSTDYPPLLEGCLLEDCADAGALFIQPSDDKTRLDDLLGAGAWLIGRELPAELHAGIVAVDLDGHVAGRFTDALAAWLDARGGAAVLVRPDRHIFGVGDAEDLLTAWHERAYSRQAALGLLAVQ